MSYIDDYLTYSSGNEAPKLYHKWSALITLSNTIGRRAFIDNTHFTIYPNIYVVLVGDPAVRKTTAMSLARALCREIPEIPLSPSSITKEALTEMMGKIKDNPCLRTYTLGDKVVQFRQMSIFANELVTLLNSGGNPMGMIEFLTDIWNENHHRVATKHRGTDDIINPYITLLGCMTPEKTSAFLKSAVIDGGFSRRACWVFTNEIGDPIPRPTVTPEQSQALTRCREHLQVISTLAGPFTWSPDAMAFFDKWYIRKHKIIPTLSSAILSSFYRAADELVLKIAMLHSLATSTDLTLKLVDIEWAITTLFELESGLDKVFAGVGGNPNAHTAERIKGFLEGRGVPVPRKEILTMFYKDADPEVINGILSHLVLTNQLREVKDTVGGVLVMKYQLVTKDSKGVGLMGQG